jgi:hypothetical protein
MYIGEAGLKGQHSCSAVQVAYHCDQRRETASKCTLAAPLLAAGSTSCLSSTRWTYDSLIDQISSDQAVHSPGSSVGAVVQLQAQ